jgi:nitrogen fixation/metabolism regulation signal transduction histidine kinase
MAIKYGDVTVNFNMDRLGSDFKSLASAFRDLISSFQEVKIEKEAQYHLLQLIVDKIGVGIIVYKEKGEILLMNQSAEELLQIQRVTDWQFIREQVKKFTDEVEEMSHQGRKLIELEGKPDPVQLSVILNLVMLRGERCHILTFHDIRNEIEQKEIEAWYKLIRILTHEIMNSVTPLGSLTDTILMLLEEDGQQRPLEKITEQQIADIRSSVMRIKTRSAGILSFVEDYRKLTQIPHPEPEDVSILELFNGIALLLKGMLDKNKIKLIRKVVPQHLCVHADPNLTEQVLINLVTNAIYASEYNSSLVIKMSAWLSDWGPRIEVTDYGKGIEPDKLNKIFIPFYSTREGGSGIGLSFSKHVMYLHKGRIKVESKAGEKTTFLLEFPNP